MRKTLLVLTPILFILLVCACKKSNNSGTSQGLIGTWNLVGITGHTQTSQYEGGEVTLKFTTDFVSKNNVGKITFNTDSMMASGLGYSVDTSFMAYFYFFNDIYDSSRQTVSYTIPPTSAGSKYHIVSTDSIFFNGGGILTALDSAASGGEQCKFVINGDSLMLTANGIDTTGGAQTSIHAVVSLIKSK